jgi:hypothetical protein
MSRSSWAVALLCLAGCTTLGRHATVSVDEYASYRRFRAAPTVERKLAASFDYLRENPRGAFRHEVSGWFLRAEPDYVERRWDDASSLAVFLRAVPLGAQADRVASRLVELGLTREYRAKSERAFDAKVLRLEGRLAAADAGRRALVSGVTAWARRLAAIRSWGGRTSDLDHEFIYAYRLSEPAARCTDEGCDKMLAVSYEVPEGKAQSPRQAIYDVGIRLEKGGVRGAWVTGPELFTRLGEAIRVAAVSPTDLVARAEAIGQATQAVALAVEAALPFARCGAEPVSPVVLRRVCDGVELRVISAVDAADEDRIVVEPMDP